MPPSRVRLTRIHRVLICVVVFGALLVAGIGFAGSYTAVSELAQKKGFGGFSVWFPLGVDVSIVVLLALDVLLDWLGMGLFLLRYAAWLLSAATIAFNGAAAWPDPLGVAMHATIPVSFLVTVEAARRAVSRLAGLSEERRMEGVRASRWLLAPTSTALLWRRMKLWELTSYRATIDMEQDRMVYRARLRARFGWAWRAKAPITYRLPLRLSRYGVPIAQSAAARSLMNDAETDASTGPQDAPALHHVSPTAERPAALAPAAPQETAAPIHQDPPRTAPPAPELAAPRPPSPSADADASSGGPPDRTEVRKEAPVVPPEPVKEPASDPVPEPPAEPVAAPARRDVDTDADQEMHARTLAAMKNADAVRYAIHQLHSFDTPALTKWLRDHGRDVNGGQAYKIAKAAEKKATGSPAESVLEPAGAGSASSADPLL